MPAAMPTPPSTEASASRARAAAALPEERSLPWMRRELLLLGVALLCGLIVMPLLIWVAGNRVLGPYTHGQNLHAGAFALLGDFFVGLAHGSAVFWVVALGPAALVLLVRLFILLVRSTPSGTREAPPARPPGPTGPSASRRAR
jgi:hypothetical protein